MCANCAAATTYSLSHFINTIHCVLLFVEVPQLCILNIKGFSFSGWDQKLKTNVSTRIDGYIPKRALIECQ